MKKKYLNIFIYAFLIFVTLVLFIQGNIIQGNYIRDIPNILKENSFKFNVSNIYSNAFFYGVNIKFILYIILFNIFIFVPLGCILTKRNRSPKKHYLIFLILTIIFMLIKSLLHISEFGIDIIILNFLGLFFGFKMIFPFIKENEDTFFKKGTVLIIFAFLLSTSIQYRNAHGIFLSKENLTYDSERSYDIDDEEVIKQRADEIKEIFGQQDKNFYEIYLNSMDALEREENISGEFKGMFVKNECLHIKIDNEVHKLPFNEESVVLDKLVIVRDVNMLSFEYDIDGLIFNKNMSNKDMCILNETIARRVNSNAEVTVVLNDNSEVEVVYLISDLYKNEVNNF